MAAKLIRLTHKIAIQLHLVAESCTICSSHSSQPVRKLFVAPLYIRRHVVVIWCWSAGWPLSSYLSFKHHFVVISETDKRQFLTAQWDIWRMSNRLISEANKCQAAKNGFENYFCPTGAYLYIHVFIILESEDSQMYSINILPKLNVFSRYLNVW